MGREVNPVVRATEQWEDVSTHPCVCEPQVMWDSASKQFRMYYRGGWGGPNGIGMAFSEDGVHWQKHPGNPIYGGLANGSGVSIPISNLKRHLVLIVRLPA